MTPSSAPLSAEEEQDFREWLAVQRDPDDHPNREFARLLATLDRERTERGLAVRRAFDAGFDKRDERAQMEAESEAAGGSARRWGVTRIVPREAAGGSGGLPTAVDALLAAIEYVEATSGCHCDACEERLVAWKRAAAPWLPTADDVRGILAAPTAIRPNRT